MRNCRLLSTLAVAMTLACVAPAWGAERAATILSVQGNKVTVADAAGRTTTVEVVDATGLTRGARVWCEDDCRSLRMDDRSIAVRAAGESVPPQPTQGLPAMPPGMPGMPPNPQAMLAQLEGAQAAARRPGDESLSCDELQTQMVAAVNDPAVAAHVTEAGAAAQQDLAAIQAAQSGLAAAQLGRSVAGALTPGGNGAALAAQAAQAQAMQAQAAQRVQSHALRAQQSMAAMPQLMRGQRLLELAAQKSCDWAAGAGAVPTGEPPPRIDERAR